MAHPYSDARGIIQPCPSCAAANRVPYTKLGSPPRCGQCKTMLGPCSAPVQIKDATHFSALIAQKSLPILVDFWAPWCGPCRMVAPEFEKLAKQLAGPLIVAKVNTEALPQLGQRLKIASIPTFALFAGGQERARSSGARSAAALADFARPYL